MNWQTWGVFLVALGLVQVILAGFFLRREKSGKASSRQAAEGTGDGSVFWVWVGRLGAICSMAGVLIIVTKS